MNTTRKLALAIATARNVKGCRYLLNVPIFFQVFVFVLCTRIERTDFGYMEYLQTI